MLTYDRYMISIIFQSSGFHIEYLAKVPEVKDTQHKQSLLFHMCASISDMYPDSTDLYSEFGALARCSRVSYLSSMKNISVGSLNLLFW